MRTSVSQIVLAQESDFNLGGLKIMPSKRQVVAGVKREMLQPRIMQVLVALARHRGEVVSRDEMMSVCWGGFAVSDDAINRCIARLRRLSECHGGFNLETIPRVGYQLVEDRAPETVPRPAPETHVCAPTLPQASIPALLQPSQALDVGPAVAAAPTWLAQHGAVAAVAFAAGVLITATVFAGAHLL